MKQNSRATNLRHLQDALAALSAAASDARVARLVPRPSPTPPPPSSHPAVRSAALRAARVGATPREIASAALLDESWARFVVSHSRGLALPTSWPVA